MLLSPANPQFICGICHPNAVRKRNRTSFADIAKPTVMQSMSCLTGNFAIRVLNLLSHAVHSKVYVSIMLLVSQKPACRVLLFDVKRRRVACVGLLMGRCCLLGHGAQSCSCMSGKCAYA